MSGKVISNGLLGNRLDKRGPGVIESLPDGEMFLGMSGKDSKSPGDVLEAVRKQIALSLEITSQLAASVDDLEERETGRNKPALEEELRELKIKEEEANFKLDKTEKEAERLKCVVLSLLNQAVFLKEKIIESEIQQSRAAYLLDKRDKKIDRLKLKMEAMFKEGSALKQENLELKGALEKRSEEIDTQQVDETANLETKDEEIETIESLRQEKHKVKKRLEEKMRLLRRKHEKKEEEFLEEKARLETALSEKEQEFEETIEVKRNQIKKFKKKIGYLYSRRK